MGIRNTMVSDSHQRHLGEKQNGLNETNANDPLLSSSSSSLYNAGNDQSMFEYDHAVPRLLLRDEVEKTGGSECGLTTSLRTDSNGYETASGVMFTIQPSKDSIELLTLEFLTFGVYEDSSIPVEAGKVQVYYREGTFSSVMKDPKAWTLIADTGARVIPPLPPSGGSNLADTVIWAIVPAHEFKPVLLKADQIYSIYISGQELSPNSKETLLKVKPASRLIGDISTENESLQVLTGVYLKGPSFPSSFEDPADFNGALHYRVTKSCNDSTMFVMTDIVLEFAVNKDPTGIVMGSLRNAVYETMSELLSSNENLAQYTKEDMLKLEGIATDLKGRSEEKCPVDFADCALIAATVSMKHVHNLDQGLLKLEILGQSNQLDASVFSYMSPVETSYVSNPLSKVEFAITLTGVPIGEVMNKVQKRYFEEVTVDFLRKSRTSKILNAIVNDEIPETPFTEDVEPPASRTRRRNLSSFFDFRTSVTKADISMLRPMRKLQDTAASSGKIQIITEIAAEGDEQELRDTVLREIGKNPVEYSRELNSQHMRVDEEDFRDFFASSKNVEVKPYDSTNGGSAPNTGNRSAQSGETENGSAWVVVCILLIVFSLLWIFYRIYMDCFYSPPQKAIKLNSGMDEFKDEEESGNVNNSLFERMKLATGSRGLSDSDVTPNLNDSSGSFERGGKNTKAKPTLTKKPSFPGLTALLNPSKPKSISDTAPARISSSKSKDRSKNSEACAVDDDFSCSSGDVESSDEESVVRRTPPRLPSGPKRGRLAPTKSLPVQKRNQTGPSSDVKKHLKAATKSPPSDQLRRSIHRSTSSPKRGRLTVTKSMPLQRRNPAKQSTNTNRHLKAVTKSPPSDQLRRSIHRSPSSPKRGRLTVTKSMPMQKRNQDLQGINTKKNFKAAIESPPPPPSDKPPKSSPRRSLSAPKRGKLIATKSMPVQKRNPAQQSTDKKKHKKATTKSPQSPPSDTPPRSSPRRTLSAPKKSKSMPVQKRNPAEQGANTKKHRKTAKKSPPSSPSDKSPRSNPRRSPSAPKKSKSVPLKNYDVNLTKTMPVGKKGKQHSKKATSFEASSSSSEERGDVLVASDTYLDKKKLSEENNANEPVKSKHSKKKIERRSSHSDKKKIERRSSHSDKKKNQDAEKKRGIKASKSIPIKKKKTKPESESSVMKLADMVHDTSDSDSVDSNSSSEVSASTNTSGTLDQTHQSGSSWRTETSKKSTESRKPYGKAGKIHFGGTKAKLANVAE